MKPWNQTVPQVLQPHHSCCHRKGRPAFLWCGPDGLDGPFQKSSFLGGGFKDLLFLPLFGEDFQFDEHIFQMDGLVQPPTSFKYFVFWMENWPSFWEGRGWLINKFLTIERDGLWKCVFFSLKEGKLTWSYWHWSHMLHPLCCFLHSDHIWWTEFLWNWGPHKKCTSDPGRGADPRCLYLWGICLLCSNYFKTTLMLEKDKHSNEAFVQDHLFCCGICSLEWCSHASNWSSHSLTFLLSNPLYEYVSAWAEFIHEPIFPVVVKTTN